MFPVAPKPPTSAKPKSTASKNSEIIRGPVGPVKARRPAALQVCHYVLVTVTREQLAATLAKMCFEAKRLFDQASALMEQAAKIADRIAKLEAKASSHPEEGWPLPMLPPKKEATPPWGSGVDRSML